MKKGWEIKTIGDVCSVLSGLWKGKKEPFQTATVIRNTNFSKDCRLDLAHVAVLEVEARQLAKRRLKPGDLILEKSGGGPKQPVGRVVYFDEPDGVYSFSNFTAVLRINDPSSIAPDYLQRFLYWRYMAGATEAMQRRSTGIRNLDMTAYMAMSVAYPTLPEQRRIVAILDEAFEGITAAKANAEKNLLNARDVFDSQLYGVFCQPAAAKAPLESLVAAESPITYGVVKPGAEGEIPFVRGGDVAKGRVLIDQLRTISKKVSDQYRRTLLQGGEVLVSLVGQPGQVAIAPAELRGANIARQVGLVRLDNRMVPEFVRLFLQSPVGQKELLSKQSGSVQQVINLSELRSIRIPVLSYDEQRTCVKRLIAVQAEMERLIPLYLRNLAALDELRVSLLHQAFTGQL